MVTVDDIQSARVRIEGRVHRTPTFAATSIGELVGCEVHLKAELLQKTGSFKIRGVLNRLLTLPDAERARGLVSLSAGNHAAALAFGARDVGVSATIVMPSGASRAKIAATESYGGEVILTDGSLMDVCLQVKEDRSLTLVHPFDDPAVIAGQGTTGLEVLEDVPEVDLVIVPVGGGGLISGIAAAIKGLAPTTSVIGVEPEGADVMTRSLQAGEPATLDSMDTIADGLAAPFAGRHTLEHVQRLVDRVVRVSDEAIKEALRLIYQRAKLATEPSGAAGLAALLARAVDGIEGRRVVCVISGGNVEAGVLKQCL